MEHILLIIQVFIAVSLIAVILVQRSSADGMSGMGGGQSNPGSLMSGRASANLLTKTTAILATLFIINSLVLSVMASRGHKESTSIADKIEATQPAKSGVPAEKSKTPAKPAAPIAQ